MKILLSAYACEPDKGSEPGVGWNWAIEIAKRGHEVVIFTRSNNKEVIQSVEKFNEILQFEYYDLPIYLMSIKKLFGVHLYYFLWQIGLFFKTKKYLQYNDVDIIHHITFVSIRKYSFLCFLGKPFYYGPLGGGETCPSYLLKNIGFKNYIIEKIRNGLNWSLKFNLLSNIIFRKARIIFVTTDESRNYLNKRHYNKTIVAPAIGIESFKKRVFKKKITAGEFKLLFAGQFIYWKGLQIAFDSLKELKKMDIPFKLTLIGEGPFKKNLQVLAANFGIDENINWIDWLPRGELQKVYKSNDVFIFPSLHDSGGMVVLEAMQQGIPVVCFNLGGPKIFVDNSVGNKVVVTGVSYHQVVISLANELKKIYSESNILAEKSIKRDDWISQFTWENAVDRVYRPIESDFNSIL